MPKQSFLSADFFIVASEKQAITALLSLPQHRPTITLLKENTLLHSMRFLYEHQQTSVQNYVDVSVLPLNEQYIHFTLHGSYTNGKRIQSDPEISIALHQFEQALQTLLQSDISSTTPAPKFKGVAKKPFQFMNSLKLIFLGKQVQL